MNRGTRSCVLSALAGAVLGCGASTLLADPLPGELLKFQQLPLNMGLPILNPYPGPFINPNPFALPAPGIPAPFAPFPGHDEISTANANLFDAGQNPIGWTGTYMADDFADRFATPVVHVRWWGSYINNQNFNGVQKFLISFEGDVPAGAAPSHPGTPLLSQVVTRGAIAPASGTFTENLLTPVGPAVPEALYQYNAELALPFPEQPDTVYWLKIVALVNPNVDGNIVWGWHDRDWAVPDLLASVAPAVVPGESAVGIIPGVGPVYHFQDDAVSGNLVINPTLILDQTTFAPQLYVAPADGPVAIGQFSKDLAFELYGVPEPLSAAVLGLGAIALLLHRRR